MSELKSEKIYRQNMFGKIFTMEVYEKSEADKVLAEKDGVIDELEERIGELQKATDSAWSKVNVYYDELRHSNYKRCLAMAKACHEKSERMYCEASTLKSLNEIIGKEPKDAVVEKFELWGAIASTNCKRWQELAEKFKEAK